MLLLQQLLTSESSSTRKFSLQRLAMSGKPVRPRRLPGELIVSCQVPSITPRLRIVL